MKQPRLNKLFLLAAIPMLLLSGCGTQEKYISIAVMGNPNNFYSGYSEGVARAVRDVNEAYNQMGYTVTCKFYKDDSSYESGSAVIDTLANDKSIIAVIGGNDLEISKTAAHVFDKAGKLFVVPYFLYDSVFENNHYDTVFSMCNSANTIGKTLRYAAAETKAKRWAICATDRELERAKMMGFIQCESDDDIEIVDCVDISSLKDEFESVYGRWETLGVEGVVMFPQDKSGFEILKNIKRKNPDIVCAGDTAFDDSALLDHDDELRKDMEGFILASEFQLKEVDKDESLLFQDMISEYEQDSDEVFDTWYIQGYNAVRMIADTAIEGHSLKPKDIAERLHEIGYNGFMCDLKFNENGSQASDVYTYDVMDDNGYADTYEVGNR